MLYSNDNYNKACNSQSDKPLSEGLSHQIEGMDDGVGLPSLS